MDQALDDVQLGRKGAKAETAPSNMIGALGMDREIVSHKISPSRS